jgi:methionyl-tRNA formyltransferase
MSDISDAHFTIAIAGSTARTRQCAQALAADPRFRVAWVLTSAAKPVGRHQVVAPNPLAGWATEQMIEVVEVAKRIDEDVKEKLLSLPKPDVLLVVDFGYLVPSWLLQLPKVAPLNLHPSALPKWRGSSPGQFVLLAGEKDSAVTLMIMDEGLDTGPILKQLPLPVDPTWTMAEYYETAFGLACTHLADLVHDVITGKLQATPQPTDSPTSIARRLTREDGFVDMKLLEWVTATTPLKANPEIPWGDTSTLIQEAVGWRSVVPDRFAVAETLESAVRALSPWPGVWTTIGGRRVKLLELSLNKKTHALQIKTFQREGKKAQSSKFFT